MDGIDVWVNTGTNNLEVWKRLSALGLESYLRHDLVFRAFVSLGIHRDGTNPSVNAVIFEPGIDIDEHEIPERPDSAKTRVLVAGGAVGANDEELYLDVVAGDPSETDDRIGRRETYLSYTSEDATSLDKAGRTLLAQLLADSEPVELAVQSHRFRPFINYNLGDWIGVREETNAAAMSYRVRGIIISAKRATAGYSVVLQLNSIALEWEIRLQQQLEQLVSRTSTGEIGQSINSGDPSNTPTTGGNDSTVVTIHDHDEKYEQVANKGQANGYAPLSSGILVPVGFLGTGTPDDTTFLRGDGTWAVPAGGGGGGPVTDPLIVTDATQINASANAVLLTTTVTLPAGKYILIGNAWVWTAGIGTLWIRANSTPIGDSSDPRNGGMMERQLMALYTHSGGSVTFDIWHQQESGTTQYGTGGDSRFGRSLLIIPASGGGANAMYSAYSSVAAAVTDAAPTYDLPGLSIASVPIGVYKAELGFHISNKSGQIRVSIANGSDVTLWPLASAARTTWGPNTDSGKEFEGSGVITVAAISTVKARAAASAAIGNYTIYDRHLTLTKIA
jgi:hypothetical protein